MGVDSLGYVGLNVSKPTEWANLLEGVFGMEARPREGSNAIDYRLDDHHHRFTLYPSKEDSVAVVGWEVTAEAKLEELVAANGDRKKVANILGAAHAEQ